MSRPVQERRLTLELSGWSPARLGEVQATTARGRTLLSLCFHDAWLHQHCNLVLDPALLPFAGQQFPSNGMPLCGMLADSSPDRWGRLLMRRREARDARREGRRPRPLDVYDYLVGVHDPQRAGALRIRDAEERCLAQGEHLAAPPWATLRQLEHAAWSLEQDQEPDDADYDTWLRLLMAPGSSLGGARPKAGVADEQGNLWIAKFPSASDERDMGAWEYVVWQLARKAGIHTPEARIERLSGKHHTFLSRRFDRANGQRIHYASAMTLTGKSDGESASYLDIVEALMRYGHAPAEDLKELWRRIVFSICVANLDDHLRNHGFLLAPDGTGWRLAPAFDQNPIPLGDAHALAIDEHDDANDLDLALSIVKYFRLSDRDANSTLTEVRTAVRMWEPLAEQIGISRAEREEMAFAFRSAQ